MIGSRLPSWAIRSLQVAVFFIILGLLWRTLDTQEALALLRSADLMFLALAVMFLTAQTIASAVRWKITAAQLGIDIPMGPAIREYYLSQVVNQSLPGGVVGDASRAVRSRKDAGLMASGQAVVFERLAGQIGLMTVLAFGLTIMVLSPDGTVWPVSVLLPSIAGLICITLAFIWIASRRASKIDTALDRTIAALTHALFAREVLLKQILLSLFTAGCNVAAFALCAAALGTILPIATALSLIPLILFAMLIPLSVSGWGLREGAAVVLFPMVGLTAEVGFATSIAFGLVFLATVVPGLFVSWMRPNAPVLDR